MIVLLYGILFVFPQTRAGPLWTLEENHPVELITFVFLLMGGALGLALAWRAGRTYGSGVLVSGFYAMFAIGLLITAMEEVAWGQWFLGFETPAELKEVNEQEEFTLHNIGKLQGHSEFFRLVFGLGGLLGVWASARPRFRQVGASLMLLPWFAIITVTTIVDLYSDYFPVQAQLDYALQRLSELIEMLIGVSGFLYFWLNKRVLSRYTR